ncbi:MAG: ArsR/SmtB family transcription factor [Phycisphaerales bacterium]
MTLLARLSALGDPARLRMLRLLEREELSVGELARSLQLPQSTVSRHLKTLHEGGWLTKRTEGTASLYRLAPAMLEESARELWTVTRSQMEASPTLREDDERLVAVLRERRRADSAAFFGRVGGEWDVVRRELFGDGFTAPALLGLLPADWTVADLGCGTGDAARLLAPLVDKVIAVDREPAMLEAARKRLSDLDNVEYRTGELLSLPIDDGALDAAVISLVLHHVEEPADVCREIARCLRPGGRLLIVDMLVHDRLDYRQRMGHVHLGFDETAVGQWAAAAGLRMPRFRSLPRNTDTKGPGLFAADLLR